MVLGTFAETKVLRARFAERIEKNPSRSDTNQLICLSTVRRPLRQITPGLKITPDEVREIIADQVLKRDVQTSEQGLEAQKKVKRALARNTKKKVAAKKITTENLQKNEPNEDEESSERLE